MKSETSSFEHDSANGPEVELVGEIEIGAKNDIPSVIMAGSDGAGGEEELNRNFKEKSLDSETSGIDIHSVGEMLLEIIIDYSIPIERYKRLTQWADVMAKSNYDASNPMRYHKSVKKIMYSASYAHNMPKSGSITIGHLPP
eukprot:15185632-Ditylum_brightwellii.AAC.1